ncbi:hypothetical protein [Streptomyces sp. NPDC004042]|uniref:hypothetical protein n=1 Tax=Streptomyces sp. NPDC004042 TaxID=3154451 RepID=UPI0033B0CAA7
MLGGYLVVHHRDVARSVPGRPHHLLHGDGPAAAVRVDPYRLVDAQRDEVVVELGEVRAQGEFDMGPFAEHLP